MNQFATASYQELARGSDNIIFSPFSIFTALSMTLDGARGQTAAEIAGVLHQAYPDPGYHAAFAALARQLSEAANTPGNELSNANGLWVDTGFRIESDFRQTIETHYSAPLTQLDFSTNPESARAVINRWTEQQTRDRIRELFGPGSLNERTRLVLTSAIYFYGKWQSPFPSSVTHPAPFQTEHSGPAEANFMSHTAQFGYAETPSAQILEMKYKDTGLAFDIFLPKAQVPLAEVESSLTQEGPSAWLGTLQSRTVEVSIPKFRAESDFSLSETLARMGMPSAFEDQSADFSGIDGRRDLVVSEVRHKAFVDVAEEGTEAAAATGIAIGITSIQVPQVTFRADHPFMFLIRDTRTGLILFAGRLMNPAQ